MKNLARLVIFFTGSFVSVLIITTAVRFMEVWIVAMSQIPGQSIHSFSEIIKSIHSVMPFTLYLSILLTISYTVRRQMPAPLSIICVFIMSMIMFTAVYIGGMQARAYSGRETVSQPKTLGEPGLILTQGSISMVLLEEPSKREGKRVVAIPGQPLLYQSVPLGPDRQVLPLPPAQFSKHFPYFFESMMLDFAMSIRVYDRLMAQNRVNFILYLGAISILLCSLRFIFTLSTWPLADLFFGAVVFRGVLSLETFIGSAAVQQFLAAFARERIDPVYFGPVIFGGLALLVIFYTFLISMIRKKKVEDG